MADKEAARISDIVSTVVSKNLINDESPSVECFDFDYFSDRVTALQKAFPEEFILHASALKANSIRGILSEAVAKGLGAECASLGEVVHALSVGFPAEKVVFDAPVKTRKDLEAALRAGVMINLDNEVEMAMVDDLLAKDASLKTTSIGIRINPVVGAGSIADLSTATKASKFGLPITDEIRPVLLDLFRKYTWLNGIHYHVGSQGVPIDMFVESARFAVNLIADIEAASGRSLKYVDIGGGLSTSYTSPEEPSNSTYELFRSKLEQAAPELLSGKYRLITEFGRSLFLKAGFSLARIDYVKNWIKDIRPIVLVHVGSNQFAREAYQPTLWRHRHSVADKDGRLKTGRPTSSYDLAGPLCFQGDYLAKDVELADDVVIGDILVIHDTGAYTYSTYSRYNSILPSAVYGFRRKVDDGSVQAVCLKERETFEENLKFWGLTEPTSV